MVSGLIFPLSSAMAMVKGFAVEPGSRVSVTALFLNTPFFRLFRSFGLNCGELTIARISPTGNG